MLYAGNNNVDNISEKVLRSLEGQIRTSVDPILCRPSAKIHFPMAFKVMSLSLLVGYTVEVANGVRWTCTARTMALFCC
jgi:hypothetical protein